MVECDGSTRSDLARYTFIEHESHAFGEFANFVHQILQIKDMPTAQSANRERQMTRVISFPEMPTTSPFHQIVPKSAKIIQMETYPANKTIARVPRTDAAVVNIMILLVDIDINLYHPGEFVKAYFCLGSFSAGISLPFGL